MAQLSSRVNDRPVHSPEIQVELFNQAGLFIIYNLSHYANILSQGTSGISLTTSTRISV